MSNPSSSMTVAFCASALLVAGLTPAFAAPVYTVIDLGTLAGTRSTSTGISSDGKYTTGSSTFSANSTAHAFAYTAGGLADQGTLGGSSTGNAVNNSGQVAGNSNGHAFLATGNVIKDLGTLSGTSSFGYGINDNGDVVGYSTIPGGDTHTFHAFLYTGGVMTDLGALGGTSSFAMAINDAGQIAGYFTPDSATTEAFLLSGGVETKLGMLGFTTSAAAISSNGYVAGSSNITGNVNAFLYMGGGLIDLGTLGGSTSRAAGVNDDGDVVGESLFNGSGFHGFLYESGALLDLNSLIDPNLGVTITDATGITDDGLITATGTLANGQTRAFLLDPMSASATGVPEPLTLSIFGAGLAGAAARRRCKPKA